MENQVSFVNPRQDSVQTYAERHNILFLLARYPGYGGIENVTTTLANALCEKHNIIIVSNRQQDEQNLLKNLNKEIAFYPLPQKGIARSKQNINIFNDILIKHNVDVIINQDSYFPNHYLLEGITHPEKYRIIEVEHNSPDGFVTTYHVVQRNHASWDIYHKFKTWFYFQKSLRNEKRNRRFLYNICDKYVVLAKAYIPLCQKYGLLTDDDKFTVIGNPMVIKPTIVSLSEKEKQCIFVGRLDQQKGIKRLMRIWGKIEKEEKEWTLVLVGDGPQMPVVKNAIRDNHLTRVKVEGFRTNVADYYRTASIFCMCSSHEGFPLVLPEAMGYGVVPIAFNSFAALSDIITPQEDAIMVEPFDEETYTAELLSLMKNQELLSEMQENAIKHSRKFDLTTIVRQWESIINQ
ncbi:MAG: glycosyltransferase [Bacteroidaceae bacterium]|nr:glycosyltransferase [Bacteroidaceae bacterium]